MQSRHVMRVNLIVTSSREVHHNVVQTRYESELNSNKFPGGTPQCRKQKILLKTVDVNEDKEIEIVRREEVPGVDSQEVDKDNQKDIVPLVA